MFSPRYQSWFGQSRIEASIDRWESGKRISQHEARQLRQNLCGNEVRAYTRGFGMHLALKALTPFIIPAKVGGLAAFVASGNVWFLLPLLVNPVIRTGITLANWWSTRDQHIPHGEALVTGWLPVIGSIAFPLQMFSARPELSTFLVRDTASRLGQRVPIYGGVDSRTEIALIRSTDLLVEFMQVLSDLMQRVWPWEQQTRDPIATLKLRRSSRFRRWIDHLAAERIAQAVETRQPTDQPTTRAA
jgi:hypothetical protein